MRKGEERYLI